MQDCDREAVLTLQNTGWTALTSPVYDRKWTESDLEKNLANGMSFFVAEVDDKIAGVLDFGPYYPFPAGKHVATFGILIAEPYQGQGLGKALLKALLTEAKAQGYIKIPCMSWAITAEPFPSIKNTGLPKRLESLKPFSLKIIMLML